MSEKKQAKENNGPVIVNAEISPQDREAHRLEIGLAEEVRRAIDREGRYSDRLDDMAAGFAAGRLCSHFEARQTISERFQQRYEQSMQNCLDAHYKQMKQYGQNERRTNRRAM